MKNARMWRIVVMLGVWALMGPAVFRGQDAQRRRSRIPSPEEVAAKTPSVKPRDGFVPDEITAVKIAQAVLIPIHGEKRIVGDLKG